MIDGDLLNLSFQVDFPYLLYIELIPQMRQGGFSNQNPARAMRGVRPWIIFVITLESGSDIHRVPYGCVFQSLGTAQTAGHYGPRENADPHVPGREIPLLPKSIQPFHFFFHGQGATHRIQSILAYFGLCCTRKRNAEIRLESISRVFIDDPSGCNRMYRS
jgi:hypothetical protein